MKILDTIESLAGAGLSNTEIARRTCRNANAVGRLIRKNGWRSDADLAKLRYACGSSATSARWTAEEDAILRRYWPGESSTRLAHRLPGRSVSALVKRARRSLGLERSEEQRNRLKGSGWMSARCWERAERAMGENPPEPDLESTEDGQG